MFKTANTFKITTIMLILLVLYLLRDEFILGGLRIYALTKSPHAYRLIGEFYNDKSYHASKHAAVYFQKALAGYKDLVKTGPENERKYIEYIIGTHYECGLGTDVNLKEAKDWYEKSVKDGNIDGSQNLEKVKQALTKIDKTK